MKKRLLHNPALSSLVFILLLQSGCAIGYNPERYARQAGPPPQPEREFRGVWIATVANIDWPSQPGLPAHVQQSELRALLDRVQHMNMNAVILQVRPAADALYDSDYEPWSWYLSGEMGKPPEPYFDPLAFAVDEAHERDLELHAWFNPFRAGHRTFEGKFSEDHISVVRPDLVVKYGDQYWMDPGMPDAREHSLRVMMDVVRRYDVDGIHMDDYFYPYPIQDEDGREVAFPDTLSWRLAGESSGSAFRADWRRQNINAFVERLYQSVKAEKPWVKVGLSPFGIWRPGNPEGIRGFDAYDKLYADARLWLQKGWVDYLSPQLYWSIDSDGQSYPKLLSWWHRQNLKDRYIWPGNSIYRIESHNWPVSEIVEQISITRQGQRNSGNLLFSMRVLDKNAKKISDRLKQEVFSRQALVPSMPWLYDNVLPAPQISLEEGIYGNGLGLAVLGESEVLKWIIRVRIRSKWHLFMEQGTLQSFPLDRYFGSREADEIVVSYVNRVGQESPVAKIEKLADQRVAAIGF